MCHVAFVFGWDPSLVHPSIEVHTRLSIDGWDLETKKETTRAWDPRQFRQFTLPSHLDGRWSGQDQVCFSLDWCHGRAKPRDSLCGGKDSMDGMRRCSKRGDPSWRHRSHGRTTLFFVEGVMLGCFRFRFHGFRLWGMPGGLDVPSLFCFCFFFFSSFFVPSTFSSRWMGWVGAFVPILFPSHLLPSTSPHELGGGSLSPHVRQQPHHVYHRAPHLPRASERGWWDVKRKGGGGRKKNKRIDIR